MNAAEAVLNFSRSMKNLCPVAAAVVAVVSACSSDSYESGTGTYSLTRADFVEVHTVAPRTADYVMADDGSRLVLAAPKSADWMEKSDTLYRAVMYYNLTEDGRAEVVSLAAIPVLRARPGEEFEEGVITDPVKFESLWLSASRRYVNIGFYLKNGTAEGSQAIHTIGVADEGTVGNADGTHTAVYRLYHDQGGVPEYYSSRYYVSIPCETIDADSVRLLINTYDGEIERVIAVR